jgi:ssDNA-binding replication factor A large subunit
MSDYEAHVSEVIKQVPEADPVKVAEAFARYEKDFLIPPEDAMRSVLRRFQSDTGVVAPSSSQSTNTQRQSAPVKKVGKLSELSSDDRNVEIEVEIVTHNPRTTMVRGEEKIVPYGLLEDQPWSEGGDRTRWEFKDWGNNPNIAPGAVVRMEGVSVNEYQGRMSININQTSRVVVLREGERTVTTPGEPVEINTIINPGSVTIVGRLLASRKDQIHRKDGSGSIDIIRGRIADDTGAIGFLSWESFDHEIGSLLKIENAQVKVFRDTPEINIGTSTRIEIFHDSNFSSADDLVARSVSKIEDLRDGSRDVEIIVEIQKMIRRDFKGKDGEDKSVWSGDIADPTGKCRCSIWSEPPFDFEATPVVVRLRGVRVRAWQGIPDITIDDVSQIEILAAAPWGDDVDLTNNVVDVPLTDLASGASRVGISTTGHIISIREDSGIISRCTECRRVLRDGECATHGKQEGNSDVRMRMVLDDGMSTISLIVNKNASESLMKMDQDKISSEINENGTMAFVQSLRELLLGRQLKASGRTIVDEQGAMLLSDAVELVEIDSGLVAAELRAKWGVV